MAFSSNNSHAATDLQSLLTSQILFIPVSGYNRLLLRDSCWHPTHFICLSFMISVTPKGIYLVHLLAYLLQEMADWSNWYVVFLFSAICSVERPILASLVWSKTVPKICACGNEEPLWKRKTTIFLEMEGLCKWWVEWSIISARFVYQMWDDVPMPIYRYRLFWCC